MSGALDLREGFSWIAGLRMEPKGTASGFTAQTLLSSSAGDDPLAAMLVIDADDSLAFRVGSCAAIISPDQARRFYHRWAMVGCYASLSDGPLRMTLELDNTATADAECSYDGPERFEDFRIGGGARFLLVGAGTFHGVLSAFDRERMLTYLRDERFPKD